MLKVGTVEDQLRRKKARRQMSDTMSEREDWDHHPGSPSPETSATPSSCTSPLDTQDKEDTESVSQLTVRSSYITLSREEKEWLVLSATADYHGLYRLLAENGRLAKLQDLSNTALHWASKLGQPEVVRLMANRIGVDVNQRSGYTPMHLAAMQGHSDIIQLLLNVYKADPNVRDHSGRKAWQYLQRSVTPQCLTPWSPLHYLSYPEGDWDVVLCPRHSLPLAPARRVLALSLLSQGSGGRGEVEEGIDVIQDGEELEADDWVFL